MDTNSNVNTAQDNGPRAELSLSGMETIGPREPPPPYSPRDSVVINQPIIHQTIIVQPPLKDGPIFYNCPMCKERVLTKVKYVNTKRTHMLAGFIGGLTFWCMLCCLAAIPYLVPVCKLTEHYCPNCDKFLGSYSRM